MDKKFQNECKGLHIPPVSVEEVITFSMLFIHFSLTLTKCFVVPSDFFLESNHLRAFKDGFDNARCSFCFELGSGGCVEVDV